MDYVFQFGIVWRDLDRLLLGAWLTVRLSAAAMVLGPPSSASPAPKPSGPALATPARVRAGLRRSDPEHALPRPAPAHLSRSPLAGHPPDPRARRRSWAWSSTSEPTRPRSCAPASRRFRAGRSKRDTHSDSRNGRSSVHHPGPGPESGLPGPRQPVRPRHARLQRRVRDLGRGADRGGRHHRVPQLPLVRGLPRRHRALPRHVARLPGGVRGHQPRAFLALEHVRGSDDPGIHGRRVLVPRAGGPLDSPGSPSSHSSAGARSGSALAILRVARSRELPRPAPPSPSGSSRALLC